MVLPLTGRRVPVVEDAAVRPEFGTGALKVTPGHDATDYEIGERHHLPLIGVIAPDGTMDVPDLPRFHGLDAAAARVEVVVALAELGAIAGEEEYVHEVGHCDRCGSVLEPLVSAQWWVRMAPLAAPAIEAVEKGEIRFWPARPHTDVYLAWMRGIRDWCISRQLWLGHAIPVATCASGHSFAWIEEPDECAECGSNELTFDPDVLDTWFSSALWPFAIFGWPEQTEDLRRFYPTTVLVTARDIVFLWVARMIMTGLRFTGSIPFSDVIINSTIQAADGSRMSKSKGNGVDPVAMIEQYGADAVRAWAGAVGTAGQDMRFNENRIASYRLFANKLWNATRLLVTRCGDEAGVIVERPQPRLEGLRPEDRWVLARVASTVDAVGTSIEQYRFHEAMERLYETTWHVFCDRYVEAAKSRLSDPSEAAGWTAAAVLDVLLRLLHPFMPFVTEECAQRLPGAAPTLQRREWPSPPAWWSERDPRHDAVDAAFEVVAGLRAARQEAGVAAGEILACTLEPIHGLPLDDVRRLVEPLARVRVVAEPPPDGRALRVVAGGAEASLWVVRAREAADVARLQRQREQLQAQLAGLRARLDNPGFLDGAPADVVEGARRRLTEVTEQLAALDRMLAEDAA